MAVSEIKKIGGTEFVARRLTVKDVRDIIEEQEKGVGWSYIDVVVEEGLPTGAVLRSLGVELDDLDELEFEDIPSLMEMVASVNPTYAAMEKRVAALGRQLQNGLKGSAPD